MFTLFSYCFANFVGLLRNLCVQISGIPSGTFLRFISFVRRLITTTLMAPKRTQVVHVNKGNDNIIIAQLTHDTSTGPMTRSKAKSISSLSTKQTSESTCLLKSIRTHDAHQPFVTLASLGAKCHSPCSRGRLPLALKEFGDEFSWSITDANSSTSSHSESLTKMSKEENYSNHSDSFTSPFLMTMLVMVTDTTSIEE